MHPPLKKILLAALLIAAAFPAASADRRRNVGRPVTAEAQAVETVLRQALDAGVPGVAVAISRGRTLVISDVAGVVRETDGPVRIDSTFQIASLTKQFTAAIVVRMAERGELSLEDDVRRWIPELVTDDRTITIRNLLNHTSGLPNHVEDEVDQHQPTTHAIRIAQLNAKPFRFRPGRMWEYNNSGYYLLGVVIERVSGRSYPEVLETEIIKPLDLSRTAFCGVPPAAPVPKGYVVTSGGVVPVEPLHMSIPFAGGAICSTAVDLARWAVLLRNGGVVSPESYEEMVSPTPITFGRPVGYGFGLALGTLGDDEMIYHDGAIPGFSSFLATIPELDLQIAVLANVQSFEIYVAREIALEILKEIQR